MVASRSACRAGPLPVPPEPPAPPEPTPPAACLLVTGCRLPVMTRAALVNGGVPAFLAALVLVLMLIAVIRLPRWTDTHAEDDEQPGSGPLAPAWPARRLDARASTGQAFPRAPGPRPQHRGGPGPRTPSTGHTRPVPRRPAAAQPGGRALRARPPVRRRSGPRARPVTRTLRPGPAARCPGAAPRGRRRCPAARPGSQRRRPPG